MEPIFSLVEFHPGIKTTDSSVTFEIKYVKDETNAADAKSAEIGAATVSTGWHIHAD